MHPHIASWLEEALQTAPRPDRGREGVPPVQPALFELEEDSRRKPERTATGRYAEPTLLGRLRE